MSYIFHEKLHVMYSIRSTASLLAGGVSRGPHVVYIYFFGFKTGKYEIKAWKRLEILVYEYEWIFISYQISKK